MAPRPTLLKSPQPASLLQPARPHLCGIQKPVYVLDRRKIGWVQANRLPKNGIWMRQVHFQIMKLPIFAPYAMEIGRILIRLLEF